MRSIALGLLMAASFSLPGVAAEPDGPAALITPAEAVRITVTGLLSDKSNAGTGATQRDALIEYYSVPDQRLLWVDDKGLTERAKIAMAEIAKADDYGLQATDYTLPDAGNFNASGPQATEWLADAEVKLSYAVLGYAKDARGGRIDPLRVSKNLDPSLALPNPSEVLDSIAIRSDPASYLRSFQPDQPQFEALRQKLIELRGGKVEEPKPAVVIIPEGPVLKLGVENEQVALLRTRLDVPPGSNAAKFDEAVLDAVRQFQSANGAAADGVVGPGTRRLLNQGQRQHAVSSPARVQQVLVNMERWRWLPHDLGAYYLMVNIPEFTLRVVEDDKIIHSRAWWSASPTSRRRYSPMRWKRSSSTRIGTFPTPSRTRRSRPISPLAAGSSAAVRIRRCCGVTVCASDMAAATSTPMRSIGAARASPISIWSSRPGRPTCSAG